MKRFVNVLNLVVAAFEQNGFAIYQSIGNDTAGPLHDAPERCAGYAHLFPGLLLGQALEISQAKRLHLINGQADLLHLAQRNASGLEIADGGVASDDTVFLGSGHGVSILSIYPIKDNMMTETEYVNSTIRPIPQRAAFAWGVIKNDRCGHPPVSVGGQEDQQSEVRI
jgi:hypothetical protein